MSPYEATPVEVANELAGTQRRCEILLGWLNHRAALRGLGILSGFQWLDGSFLEKKDPNDLDIVTFFRRPAAARTPQGIQDLFVANPVVFRRPEIKATYHLDAMFVDMDGTPEAIVDSTRYWLGLFSHRRVDHMWKGMLKVDLSGNDDVARRVVATLRAAHGQVAGAP